jgi:hypothetical protein
MHDRGIGGTSALVEISRSAFSQCGTWLKQLSHPPPSKDPTSPAGHAKLFSDWDPHEDWIVVLTQVRPAGPRFNVIACKPRRLCPNVPEDETFAHAQKNSLARKENPGD